MRFYVDRDCWARGGKWQYGASEMLNSVGCMCCLGHCALQLGFKKQDLYHAPLPEDVVRQMRDYQAPVRSTGLFTRMVGELKVVSTDLAQKAAYINDSYKITDESRERRLKLLFRKYGHTIEFGSGPDPQATKE